MKKQILRQFPLFAHLPDSEIDTLVESLQEHAVPAGEILFRESASSKHFYILLEGDVEIVKALGTADERVVALSRSGSVLGEMSMFSADGLHTASARARSPLRLLKLPFNEFDKLLERNPRLALDLLRLYSRRLQDSESLTIQDLREKNRQLTEAYLELQAAQAIMLEKERLESELQIAAQMQCSILPEQLPSYPGLDFGALLMQARKVGGDFYDFIPLDENRVGILVGDVCDKGIPAALFMALTYSSLRSEAQRHNSPGDALRAVNQNLLQINRSDLYVTLLYGILDCRTREFAYARAGHPDPVLLDGSHQPVVVPHGLGQPVGMFDRPAIDEQRITIPPGGLLLVYSDGLSETIENSLEDHTLTGLCASLLGADDLDAQGLCSQLWLTLGGDTAASLIEDDFTVVALMNQAG